MLVLLHLAPIYVEMISPRLRHGVEVLAEPVLQYQEESPLSRLAITSTYQLSFCRVKFITSRLENIC